MKKKNTKNIFIYLSLVVILSSCSKGFTGQFIEGEEVPDYSQVSAWASHPEKTDEADRVPKPLQGEKIEGVDVFFVHPTTYTGKAINESWNGSITDIELNKNTDNGTIKLQASIFNIAERLFAPRYRQAHLSAYSLEDKPLMIRVFNRAYEDVKQSFQYYLDHYNQGRPFIIASHSQGTTHSTRLIAEMIDGTPLQEKMIAAYLIGMPVSKNRYKEIQPCSNPEDTNCFISWRTFKKGYMPKSTTLGDTIAVHNPITWKMDDIIGAKVDHKGSILRNFDKVYVAATETQVTNGILWATKPKFPFSFLFTAKNYHIADLNFFYVDVRENVIERAKAFRSK